MKTRLMMWCGVFMVAALVGCSKAPSEPPVAAASLTLSATRVPLGSPLEITYEFKVAADAPPFPRECRVFVHFVDADDELMWTDDHVPPTPMSEWKAGQTIKYSRVMFVPVYPYVGEGAIDIGLYTRDGKRLTLAGTDQGQRSYRMAKIQVAPQTENVYITFKDGWHGAEIAADNANTEWQWSKKEATISFKNPKRDATFFLDIGAPPAELAGSQTVTVSLGEQVLDTFKVSPTPELRRIPISAAQFGQNDQAVVKLAVDRTFVPAELSGGKEKDTRELGIRVFHVFLAPR